MLSGTKLHLHWSAMGTLCWRPLEGHQPFPWPLDAVVQYAPACITTLWSAELAVLCRKLQLGLQQSVVLPAYQFSSILSNCFGCCHNSVATNTLGFHSREVYLFTSKQKKTKLILRWQNSSAEVKAGSADCPGSSSSFHIDHQEGNRTFLKRVKSQEDKSWLQFWSVLWGIAGVSSYTCVCLQLLITVFINSNHACCHLQERDSFRRWLCLREEWL